MALALLGLLPESIDLVISEINPCANLGYDSNSGTVIAAMEAAIGGVPGIAVSLNTPEGHQEQLNYSPAGRYAYLIAKQVISHRH